MPPRHCLMKGCREYSLATYCIQHEYERKQDYKGDWTHIRQRNLKTRCQRCGRPARHLDHKTPRRDGGTNHPSNLMSLCRSCHNSKTAGGG